jgi:hypothetical protein
VRAGFQPTLTNQPSFLKKLDTPHNPAKIPSAYTISNLNNWSSTKQPCAGEHKQASNNQLNKT